MKKIYKNTFSFLSLVALLLGSWQATAQISFTNSNDLLESTDWHSGVALAVVDMNNDGLDDILRLDQGNVMTIEFQVTGQNFIPYTYGSIDPEGNSQWAIAAGDINNNSYNDVLCGDVNNSKVVTADPTDPANITYSHEVLAGSDYFAQGSNFSDINNDGYLDIFVCNDVGTSKIWLNNQDGTFSESDIIDLTTTPTSDNSGNYGSIWTDFDNDGDIDLYIAKCRQGVSDPTDPRRINALYVNDGQNNYTEEAIDFGLKIGWQSWTSDFNDIDNDGDLDVFLTNHDFANIILENDGAGHYTDISTGQNIGIASTSFPLQGVMRDFDNDGFMDILVSGSAHHLYRNLGDGTFEEVNGLFDNNAMESFALGDLNNDGFVDIYGGYANIYTNPSDIDDVIWMNNANDNNWFGVNLEGVISNKNGVGARVEIYGDWGIQIREVRAGESYGIMNSFKQNFGIGTSTEISHVVVKWPSGIISVIENPGTNEYLDIIEIEGCDPFSVEIAAQGNTVICAGESVSLTAPDGYGYLWNNGTTTSEITVSEAGGYSVIVQDLTTGCYGISQNLLIENEPDETPTVTVNGDLEFCAGGSVTLTSSEANGYEWSNGETSQSIEVSEAGEYYVTTEGFCSDNNSASFVVTLIEGDAPEVEPLMEVTYGTPFTLMATGTNPQWYDAETGGNYLGDGPTLDISDIAAPTYYWVSDMDEFASAAENTGQLMHAGSEYSGPQWNGGIEFDALNPFILKSVLVYTDTEAERLIELKDANGDVIESLLINIPVTGDDGMRFDLNFEVPAGTDLSLTTNEDQNNAALGNNNPRLKRSSEGVNYNDYVIEDLVNMTGSSIGGTNRYYYFYDWEVQPPSLFCESERVSILAEQPLSTISIGESQEVQLFPNPTNGQVNLTLDFTQNTEVSLSITDLAGKQVYTENIGAVTGTHNHDLNLSQLAKGIYLVQVSTPENTYFGKIAVQ